MSEEVKKRIEDSAMKYAESFKTGEWFERIRYQAYMEGAVAERTIADKEKVAVKRTSSSFDGPQSEWDIKNGLSCGMK